MFRTSIYMGTEEREYISSLKRSQPALSAIVRWVILALVLSEKQFLKRRDESKEGTEVANFLRGRIEKLVK